MPRRSNHGERRLEVALDHLLRQVDERARRQLEGERRMPIPEHVALGKVVGAYIWPPEEEDEGESKRAAADKVKLGRAGQRPLFLPSCSQI